MNRYGAKPIFSATDLVGFLACEHNTQLDRAAVAGLARPPIYDDPAGEALAARGDAHEAKVLEILRARRGGRVTSIERDRDAPDREAELRRIARETEEAIRRGDDLIYQAAFLDLPWQGHADFLLRVETPSKLGPWSYEVADAKLARHTKAGAILQMCLYSDLLARIQGTVPERMHVWLGAVEPRGEPFRVSDYLAYTRAVRRRFEAATLGAPEPAYPPSLTYPDPVEHCSVCRWDGICDDRRHADDHLSLVANISRNHRRALSGRAVNTMTDLARLPLPAVPPIERVSRASLTRVREQARVQVEGRDAGEMRYELMTPVEPDRGLAVLPPPSPGDLFFDIEGAPYAFDVGLEYLLGVLEPGVSGPDGPAYTSLWAMDRASEKQAFERFVDMVMERLARDPGLHIYHYNHYEPTALKKLVGRHVTREEEIDQLLRGEVFVDLYRVVRQGVRASVESYSLKRLEPLYGFERRVDLREATKKRVELEVSLELGGEDGRSPTALQQIEDYNRDDCLSTWRLRDWLEARRDEIAANTGQPVPRPSPQSSEPSEDAAARTVRVRAVMDRLTHDVSADPSQRSPEQQARWLLAQMLEWHRREKKSTWWEYFRLRGLTDEQLIEDPTPIGGLTFVDVVGSVRQSLIHRYRFPAQDHSIRLNSDLRDPRTGKSPGDLHSLDTEAGIIEVTRGKRSKVSHPTAVIPVDSIEPNAQKDSLLRLGEWVAEHGITGQGAFRAARDLLLRELPRLGRDVGGSLTDPGESPDAAAIRLCAALDDTVLAIQGPPGAGKTHTGARMIVALLKAGKRVGVTANSHKVIGKLLQDVCDAAAEGQVSLSAIQKASDDQWCGRPEIDRTDDNAELLVAVRSGPHRLFAGTGWLWARPDMADAVDVLFIDEAGQMSLANVLAVSPAARSLVMLGDPQQLDQPIKGAHPPGAETSALEHILGSAATMPPERGLFLDKTWRLHPDICRFTSGVFYEGRLASRQGCERQTLVATGEISGTGLRFLPVEHFGNQSESEEEAEIVAGIVRDLLDSGAEWVDWKGGRRRLRIEDILILTPYNAQVAEISGRIAGASVGTVDKFQGQQAPVAIYSMATSSPEDAPRDGMEFLYSGNRLNVATSRARCVSILVCSPALVQVRCKTPREMKLANAFCEAVEMAGR